MYEEYNTLSGKLLAVSDIREADGNFTDGSQRLHRKYILEAKTRENDVKYLSMLLAKSERPAGILRCLGYRQPAYHDLAPPMLPHRPIFELVFEAPAAPHKSLTAILTGEGPLEFKVRLQLAKRVIKSLLGVHALGLVHKAIRSRAILVANWSGQITLIPNHPLAAYLLDWTYVRETSGATSWSGGDLLWSRMIYQHPERQGSPGHHVETDFEPKHDIYSIGVVMLETLLWNPFITQTTATTGTTGTTSTRMPYPWQTEDDDPATVFHIGDVFEQRALRLGEANGGLPPHYAGNSAKLASRPNATKTVWKSLASEDLALMSKGASNVVLKCLDCRFESVADVLEAMELVG